MRICIDDSAAIVRAAEVGNGLALARWSLVADEIRSGRLAMASKQVAQYGLAYYFVCPLKLRETPKVATFYEWLRSETAKHAPPGHEIRR
jgi:DNA-binding transcriptional LysR family regulator